MEQFKYLGYVMYIDTMDDNDEDIQFKLMGSI